jgi:cobalamin biosynthesis protein CobD/CbiB
MSGALKVRLGGKNSYDGKPMSTPLIGERFSQPSMQEAKRAIRIAAIVSALGVVTALLLRRRTK